MPTIKQNKRFWDINYDWRQQGDEWSAAWGGADMQWYASILPRIHTFVPCGSILEIGPGYGRWTRFLKDLCERLVLVDLSEKCIQACNRRFASCRHIASYVNDGKSLGMIPDESIDFVFSFDSLVHAEGAVIEAYLDQLSKKLKKDGVGFIHHSNAGELRRYYSLVNRVRRGRGLLVRLGLVEAANHWRAYSVTAARFEKLAEEAGLRCVSQELINWPTSSWRAIDCISVFARKESVWTRPNRVFRNRDFAKEASNMSKLSELYGAASFEPCGCYPVRAEDSQSEKGF